MNAKEKPQYTSFLSIRPFNRILIFFASMLACFWFTNTALAFPKTVLEQTFVRGTGKPTTESVGFAVPVSGEGNLKIVNGQNGGIRISSASISLNGKEIVGPDKFNQNVSTIEFPIQLLNGDNALSVKLNGNPGGSISVQVAVELIAPPLVTKEMPVQLTILQDHNIQLDGLIISTLLSEHTLAAGETSARVLFADADKGQILFITDTTGTPFIISYIDASDIQSGTTNITLDSIANGLIMANPIMMGYKQSDRLAILSFAQTTSIYQDLKVEINNALQIEPHNLLQEAVFPKVYEYSLTLVIEAIRNYGVATAAAVKAQAIPLMAPTVTVGNEDTPYLSDVNGSTILAVNPTMAFYGLTIDGKPPQVIAGKESWWELKLGWPPSQFTDPVTKVIDLGDGNFNITYSKLGLDINNAAILMADAANFLRGVCIFIDTFYWCPASNETIETIVEKGSNLSDIEIISLAGADFLSLNTAKKVFEKVIEELKKEEVWRAVINTLYTNAADKKAAISFLEANEDILIEFAKTATKVLIVYDAANVTVPFGWDLALKPLNIKFCINQKSGILTASCQFIPPTAIITKISPDEIYVGDTVTFDASRSFDDLDSTDSLMVRWDFNGDGIYDTGWSVEKISMWSYKNVGAYDVRLQVMDKDNLIGQTEHTVVINALNAGGTATHIKAFRDVLPWNTTSFEVTMTANGYTTGSGEKQYEILPSSALATAILTPGNDLIVIMNDQDQTFYNNLATYLSRLDRFLQNGGVVIWGACDEGWHYGSMAAAGINALPGGVQYSTVYDSNNYNVNPTSTLMEGLPSVLSGSYASHEHFLNVPTGSIIYMKDTADYPTLAEYKYGNGWMVLTGQPLEYNVVYNSYSMGVIYSRLFNYVLGQVTKANPAAPVSIMGQAIIHPFSHIDK